MSGEAKSWNLRQVPLFDGLTDHQLAEIEEIVLLRVFPAGDTVIEEGAIGDALYILIEGTVEVSKAVTLRLNQTDFAEKPKVLNRLDGVNLPFFGEMAIFDDSERSATVVAVTECKMLEIDKCDFEKLAEHDTALGYQVARNILRVLSNRLRTSNRDVLKLTTALSLALNRRR